MREPHCSCGHGVERHTGQGGRCTAKRCRCEGIRNRALSGVYNLETVRKILQQRSGRGLLGRRPPAP